MRLLTQGLRRALWLSTPDRRTHKTADASNTPKPTRKPARPARRKRRTLPRPDRRAIAAIAVIAVLAPVGVYGWRAHQAGTFVRWWREAGIAYSQATTRIGFAIADVTVEGRGRTTPDSILKALSVRRGDPILDVDLAAAGARIAQLPWIESAVVRRRLPGHLHITLVEREPFALWQRDGKLELIDPKGTVIPGQDPGSFSDLPVVVGEGAADRAYGLLLTLATQPALYQRVRAVSWIGNRRWTVRIDDEIDVHLPESDPRAAWDRLAELDRDHGVLARDVVAVDLRVPDQLVVRVAPGAMPPPPKPTRRGQDT